MKMPELRPIPYIPNSKEAEEQTIREYALAYGEMVREACAKLAESMTADPPQTAWAMQQFIASAIRGEEK